VVLVVAGTVGLGAAFVVVGAGEAVVAGGAVVAGAAAVEVVVDEVLEELVDPSVSIVPVSTVRPPHAAAEQARAMARDAARHDRVRSTAPR
jgi:hypothetical protein